MWIIGLYIFVCQPPIIATHAENAPVYSNKHCSIFVYKELNAVAPFMFEQTKVIRITNNGLEWTIMLNINTNTMCDFLVLSETSNLSQTIHTDR